MKIVALLPMKGNSERVPNKNLKEFNGLPLFHRVLNSLLDSRYIHEIVINTDSYLIQKNIQENYGSKVCVISRPDNIVGDAVSMNKIIEYDINQVEADFYLQTHSTNPLLSTKSIDLAIQNMIDFSKNKSYDSIFSVTKLQTRLYDQKGKPFNHNPEELLRTQDLEPLYEENSNFYIFTKDSFMKAGKKRIGLKPFMYDINKIEAIDIDEPEDFIIAETLFKLQNGGR